MGNTNSSAPKAKPLSASSSSNLAAAAAPADDPNVNVLPRPIPKNVTPLKDCKTLDEHEACIHYAHEITRGLHGLEGLHALGFDYRFVPCCAAHDPSNRNVNRTTSEDCCVEINQDTSGDNDVYESNTQQQQSQSLNLNRGDHEEYNMNIHHSTLSSAPANETSSTATTTSKLPKSHSVISLVSDKSSINEQYANHCQYGCATRLFFVGPTLVSRLMQNKKNEENEDREGGESEGTGEGNHSNSKPLKEGAIKEENDMMERSHHAKEQHDRLAEDTTVNQSNQTSPSTESRVDESPVKSPEQHHPAVSANSSPEQHANTPTTANEAPTQPPKRPNESEPAVMITTTNRQEYIADGSMYELLANLAQEMAQSKMCAAFDLEWITVCDEIHLGEHVRALVDKDHRRLLEEGENKVVLQELLLSSPSSVKVVEEEKEEKKDEDHNHDNSESHQTSATSTVPHQYHSQNDKKKPHQTSLNKTKSTLLIATGRGKVRAGIFSRHHLLTAGIEVGTSWHCIREARMRNWGVAIIDPNARGEEVGYESFKRSMSRLFLGDTVDSYVAATDDQQQQHQTLCEQSSANGTTGGDCGGIDRQSSRASLSNTTTSATSAPASSSTSSSHSIYILAHSASGGQLVRHLREDSTLLPSISAIAFTDSTHNVQWCKHDPTLKDFLQKKNCVYLRSNDVRSSQSCVKVSSRGKDIWCNCITCVDHKKSAGMEADTDNFWEHRFGSIKTLWAGTADHALSNWAGHASIWDHFDEHANSDDDDCLNSS